MASKSDTPFRLIDTNPAYTSTSQAEYTDGVAIHGFDTETADGGLFMATVAWDGQEEPEVIHNDGKYLTKRQVWGLITDHKARSSHNVWYNLNFDASVILSHVLDRDQLTELQVMGSVQADDYHITYIPSKFLSIRDSSDNVYKHYDVSQFFYAPLDEAAQEWMNVGKLDDVDTSKFGTSDSGQYPLNDYILDKWFEIRQYAKRDAKLVRDLWTTAVETGENLPKQVPMGKPYSTGYLAESFLNEHMDRKPGIGPTSMASTAWEAYAGGRFEPYRRGDVGNVAGPDINSAYPWVLSELPDPDTLRWTKLRNPTLDQLQKADYGFVKATVWTDEDRNVQPFVKKMDGVVKYPVIRGGTVTTLLDIFMFAEKAGYLDHFDIQYAWLGDETGATRYPFDFVEETYSQRKDFESNDRPKAGKLLKIVLNSMYGKTCQTTPKRSFVDDSTELDRVDRIIGQQSLPDGMDDCTIIERLQSGSWFNPFIASYITGRTRLELHKRTVEYGLEDNVVMLATDCAMYDRDAYEASGFADDLVDSGLGAWDYDYHGRAFVVGAGVYEVELPDGDLKTQTRGFREADLTGGLRQAAQDAENDSIQIESLRPTTPGEAVWSGQPLSDVGAFTSHERELRPDMDTKRCWPDASAWTDLLGHNQASDPLIYEPDA